ncbi:MAG: Lnb N-terminal periplasmic domain-containing protein [Elusimicrobiota bacterium]
MPLLCRGGIAALLLLISPFPGAAADRAPAYLQELLRRAEEKDLAGRPHWRRLMHERRGLLGGRKSSADGRSFFLSPRGRRDSRAELAATLQGFFETARPGAEDSHPQCRFPARYAWLKSELAFDSDRLPEKTCPDYEKWRAGFDPESITLVFASSFLSNPASMYGHTFFRLDQKNRGEGERLVDYSVSFGADTTTRNGLLFAVKGLAGGYPGRFSTEPYYFKVQKYNNIESRHLWEYRLALGPESLDRLLAHLWELGGTHFDYYFLTDNCSYQLLPLLEAADPSLDISRQFRFKVIPADTIRAVLPRPGLVSERKLRPSAVQVMLARRRLLTPEERSAAEAVARGREEGLDLVDRFPPDRQILVLDSAHDYFRYRQGYARFQTPSKDEWERRILLKRGRIGLPSPEPPPAAHGSPPETGHPSGRAALGIGFRKGSAFQELTLRGALHDLTEDPRGYDAGGRLEMFHLIARRDGRLKKFYIEKFTLVDIVSLAPLDAWVKKPSWKLFIGLDGARDGSRPPGDGLHARLGGAYGAAAETRALGGEIFYALAEADMGAGGAFGENDRTGAGGTAGLLWTVSRFWRVNAETSFLRYFAGDVRSVTRAGLTQSFQISRTAALRAQLRREGSAEEALVSFLYYF